MQKKFNYLLVIFVLVITIVTSIPNVESVVQTPVKANEGLEVIGNQLCNSKGKPIQLKGMSFHGLQWYGAFINQGSINTLVNNWHANVIRLAMYTDEGGYITNPRVKAKVEEGIKIAVKSGIYVIVDWHILHDNNPNKYKTQAISFFQDIARKYGKKHQNIIYEICNEPNGDVKWNRDIKPYAENVIKAIRAIDKNNIIIVGTGTWSQDLQDVAVNPIKDATNIMYVCHFYAGTHTKWLRDRIDTVRKKGIPVFITEWGTTDASGNGKVCLKESTEWMNFCATRKISWCNWSLCDKNEASAALRQGANPKGGWKDSNLSESGIFVKKQMLR